jgi:hypothetical protein
MDEIVEAAARPSESFHDYRLFNGSDADELRERWGDVPTAAGVAEEDGSDLLDEAWEKTRRIFEENLKSVEELVEIYNIDELMENRENARLHFLRLGATVGPSVPLYTETSYPIRDRDELNRYLETHGEVWIVPVVGVS